jgi:hypothetical protein
VKQVLQLFIAGAMVASTALAVPAAAQTPPPLGTTIQGVVQSVDPATRTIHFQDGRTLVLDPGATLLRDGRQFPLTQLQPGMVITTGAPSTAPTAMQGGTVQATTPRATAEPVTNHPAIDVSGVVAAVDPSTGTIRFADGRMVKATDRTQVFEAARLSELRGGDQVIMKGVQPMSVNEPRLSSNAMPATPASRELGMGTVKSVDANNGVAVLTDGRTIRLTPGQTLRYGNTTVTYLQPGDEIVFYSPTTSGDAVSASPPGYDRQRSVSVGHPAMLDASDVQVVWRAQRP